MKKILFGTTAVIAAGLISAPASAADFDLGFSGSYTGGLGYVTSDVSVIDGTDTDDSGFHLINDGEIVGKAEVTLDNGLTFGAKTELDVFGDRGVNTDESMMWLNTGFGKFELGEEDGAADWGYNGGANGAGCVFECAYDGGGIVFDYLNGHTAGDPDYNPASTSNGVRETNDDLKISYYTPSFSGFSLGGSYAFGPRDEAVSFRSSDDAAGGWEVGARYSNTFGDTSFGIGAGVSELDAENDMNWGLSATAGWNGLDFSVGYADNKGNNTEGLGAGLGYSTGPWEFGLSWGHDLDDDHGIGLGAAYTLGDGVKVGGTVGWADDGSQSVVGGGLLTNLSF